jgi:YhcH/YjgK/YiaL family protein
MALFGTYGDLSHLLGEVPLFAEALDYLRQCLAKGTGANERLAALAEGVSYRTELRDGVYAMESAYVTRPRSECFFESHRRYIDVQAIVEGEEFIEVVNVERLRVTAAYVPEKDLVKFADFDFASRLRLGPGDLAIFFPPDGHLPCLQISGGVLVRKTVVKVPVPSGLTFPG